MGDKGPGDAEDPGISRERPLRQFRQLAVVAGRQIIADLADLLLDHVVIVEQPFGGRHDGASALKLRRAGAVSGQKSGRVGVQSLLERQHARRAPRDRLRRRKALRMLLQPLDAEKLLAHGLAVVPRRGGGLRKNAAQKLSHVPLSGWEAGAAQRGPPQRRSAGEKFRFGRSNRA